MSEREVHKGYWDAVPSDATYPTDMSKMLLMDDPAAAEREGEADTVEVLALVPALPKPARIVELAAGVGRFTPRLAAMAGRDGKLTAYDFVEDFCDKNRATCRALGLDQVDVRAEDARITVLPTNLDLVFASWILMYLSNDEVLALLGKIASSLKSGGFFVFRESCIKADVVHPGDWPRFPEGEHPCRYRSARWYTEALATLPGRLRTTAHVLRVWDDDSDPNAQLAWVWERA
jgi:ubiquinone/menaquinone biosynthesis C-methylase UbiE